MIIVLSLGISLQDIGRDKVFFDCFKTPMAEEEGVIWEVVPDEEKVVSRIYRDILPVGYAFYLIYPDTPTPTPREVNVNFIKTSPASITFVRLPPKDSFSELWLSPRGKAGIILPAEKYSYTTKENGLTFRVKIENVSTPGLYFRAARLYPPGSFISSEREVFATLPDKTLIHLEQTAVSIDASEDIRRKIYEAGKEVHFFMRDTAFYQLS
jgi:hypothetical protein